MKTERRHELQTNELADWLGEAVDTVKPYVRVVLGIFIACLVLIAAWWLSSSQSKTKKELGWNRYFRAVEERDEDALEQVAQKLTGTPAGYWSSLLLADRKLNEGTEALFSERAKANEALKDAVDLYQAAAKSDEPLVQQRAAYGLARAYESQKSLGKAREAYEKLQRQWPNGIFNSMAQKRLDDLSKKQTVAFYDWFAKQKPKPALPENSGLPDFNLPPKAPDDDSLLSPRAPDLLNPSKTEDKKENGADGTKDEGTKDSATGAADEGSAGSDAGKGATTPAETSASPDEAPATESGSGTGEPAGAAPSDEPGAKDEPKDPASTSGDSGPQ